MPFLNSTHLATPTHHIHRSSFPAISELFWMSQLPVLKAIHFTPVNTPFNFLSTSIHPQTSQKAFPLRKKDEFLGGLTKMS